MINILKLLLLASFLWIPYYVWGIREGNRLLESNRFVFGCTLIALTTLLGFVGLHLIQRFYISPDTFSVSNFRVLLIISTQFIAVSLIAIDSNFSLLSISAGLMVMAGAVMGAYAVANR
jgi:hypothetical protein